MKFLVVVLLVAASLAGGFYLGRRGAAPAAAEHEAAAEDEDAAPRRVRVGHVRRAALERRLHVTGTVSTTSPRVVAAPFDAIVSRFPQPIGAKVEAGAAVVELTPTPVARAARAQAIADEAATAQALAIVEQRLSAGLATLADRQQADQAAAAARRSADDWRARLAGDTSTITAPASAVVAALSVAEGQWVAAGSELLRLTGDPIARFGLEPADAAAVAAQAPIRITASRRPDVPAMDLQVTSLSAGVDPESHLVDASVALPPHSAVAIGDAIVGEIAVTLPAALIVPRDAIDPAHGAIFVIGDGHVHQRAISVLGTAGDDVAIAGDGIADDDAIATSNVHALADGDAVEAAGGDDAQRTGEPPEDAPKP